MRYLISIKNVCEYGERETIYYERVFATKAIATAFAIFRLGLIPEKRFRVQAYRKAEPKVAKKCVQCGGSGVIPEYPSAFNHCVYGDLPTFRECRACLGRG